MPKIVDHDVYRRDLAVKAVDIFSEHGVNGLGMRGIAEALGISKSALYHYFSSKEELFKASTEVFLEPNSMYGLADGEGVPENKEQALTKLITVLDSRFRGELTLMLDYVKGKSDQQVQEDSMLCMANRQFKNELGHVVGEQNADQAYALLFGGLSMRLMDGKRTEISDISQWILALCND